MTLLAAQLGMLSLQSKSRESAMFIFLAVQFGEGKLPPVVFHVAMGTIHLSFGNVIGTGVIANMLFHAATDFCVTVQTFEAARGQAEIVTSRAFSGAFQRLVRTRERAGRDLRAGKGSEQ